MKPGRRDLLGLLAGLPFATRLEAAETIGIGREDFRPGATVLVPGPNRGHLDRLSRAIVPALSRALPPGTMLTRTVTGGPDGVTGANQFDARTEPDGLTLLMVPGAAALAWLSGDPRAQFDAGKWVPVMAATTPAVLAGKIPPPHPFRGRLRVAASSATGPEMAALLALDLIGIPFMPVFGLGDPAASRQAFAQGSVDLVLAHGADALEQLGALAAVRGRPLFALGVPGEADTLTRDPLLPEVPEMLEYAAMRGATPHGQLYFAWRSAAAASRLEYALVLPQLTPPAMVAAWRRAGLQTVALPDIGDPSGSIRAVAAPAANPCVSTIAANASALLELRRWLAQRFNWSP